MDGIIYNIQPFSVHDGPGLRTVVFLKGCNLRCFWCHNPESQSFEKTLMFHKHKCIGCGACKGVCQSPDENTACFFSDDCDMCGKCVDECFSEAVEIIGKNIDSESLFDIILKDKKYFSPLGGVTFSGGEPLLQADFLADVMERCKGENIHTAVETALCVPWENIEKILPFCDYFICDIKTFDNQTHIKATGRGNEIILRNAELLSKTEKKIEIRTPVIPTVNDEISELEKIADFVKKLGISNYSLLPFHSICSAKYESMNLEFKAKNIEEPTTEKMNFLNAAIKKCSGKGD